MQTQTQHGCCDWSPLRDKALMRRATSCVLCSDRSSWTSHEWEERWKEAHKSHLVHYLLSAAAEESENLFWGLMCRTKQGSHAFHLPCLGRAAGTGFAELHLGRSPVESSVEGWVWSSQKSHRKGLGWPVRLLEPIFPVPGSSDSGLMSG